MSFVLTLWDRRLQPPRGTAPKKSSDYGAEQGGETIWVQVLGGKIRPRFVAGLSAVNLRREVNCGCVVCTPGKIEEV